MGEKIHNEIPSRAVRERGGALVDVYAKCEGKARCLRFNALVDMYAKCGAIAKGPKVLDGYPLLNVVTGRICPTWLWQRSSGLFSPVPKARLLSKCNNFCLHLEVLWPYTSPSHGQENS
ncbi:hypothetical protein GOP47_0023305 [Adiantum capillus-veneris]|uniref:Uncharacterized protein n=1 Tax=Adiantum capillus-veneris TaxID=13818 RepID=A0A9D4U750_ADICA|nr:hypothetical protein GOP47_0023305 [Adiantum capillus-veneris]